MLGKRFVFDHHDLSPELYISRYRADDGFCTRLLKLAERASLALADITIATNEATGEVTAYINDKDRQVKQELEDGSDTKVKAEDKTKSDQDGFKTSIPVKCLKCGAQLK